MTSHILPPERSDPKLIDQAGIEAALQRALVNLKERKQNGWWSYVQDKGPSIEATGWCAIAMQAAGAAEQSSDETASFLLKKQNRDGGWSTAPLCGPSDWSTAAAVLYLRLLDDKSRLPQLDAIERSVLAGSNFLFDLRTDPYHSVGRLLLFLMSGEEGLHYARGWPWNKDCSFWVEPTSYSLLALKLPRIPDRTIIRSSIRYAQKYLYAHVCQAGGWNHGAQYVLKVFAPPYTVTTAEALLALQDEPLSPIIESALQVITEDRLDSHSSLALALSILALHTWNRKFAPKTAQLIAHQNPDGSFGTNNMVTALAVLALLAAGRNINALKMSLPR